MFRFIIVILLSIAVSSCQSFNIDSKTSNNKIDASAPKNIIEELSKSKEEHNKSLYQLESFWHTLDNINVQTKRYGSSLRILMPRKANFETNSATVNQAMRDSLNKVIRQLHKHNYKAIKVFGFADSRGKTKHNKQLSFERAKVVSSFIEEHHSISVDVEGLGEHFPVANNNNRRGQSLNRRTEIVVHF